MESSVIKITVKKANNLNKKLGEIVTLLKKQKDILAEAIIHGSYATGEEINYSDIDLLLITKDKLSRSDNNKKLDKLLNKLMKCVYKVDALQHHNAFVISEKDFDNYPQSYFPYELYDYSRCLIYEKDYEFEIRLIESVDYKKPFIDMMINLNGIIDNKRPKNMYQLKSFLSGMMLTPSLFLQAIYKKGIYKKNSFVIAKNCFLDEDWIPIEISSKIRNIWDFKLNIFQRYIMTKHRKAFRRLTKYFVAPSLPIVYKDLLNDNYYQNCKMLLNKMKNKIDEIN